MKRYNRQMGLTYQINTNVKGFYIVYWNTGSYNDWDYLSIKNKHCASIDECLGFIEDFLK